MGKDYVDKVGVRVYPDLTGFDTSINRATSKKRTATVTIALKNLKEAQTKLDAISKENLAVGVELSLSEAQKTYAKFKAQLDEIKPKKVVLEADIGAAQKNLDKLKADLAEAPDIEKVVIKADIEQASERIRTLTAQMKQLREIEVTARAETKDAKEKLDKLVNKRDAEIQAKADTLKAKAELARTAMRRTADVVVRVIGAAAAATQIKAIVSGLSGFTMIKNWTRSLQAMVANMPQTVLRLSMLLPVIAGIGASALSAMSSLAPFAASVAAIAPGALIAAPAVGALAASVGVLVAAFKGLDESTATRGAKAFNGALTAAKDQLSGVKRAIQQTFFESGDFTAGFKALASTVLPQMKTGLADLSGTMSTIGVGIMGSLTTALSGSTLSDFFAQVKLGAENSSSGVTSLITALTNLSLKGSSVLPTMGEWVSRIGESFSTWVLNTDIEAKLTTAAAQAGNLWQVLKNLGGIISGVFGAMNTGRSTGLESLAATLGTIRDIVQGPAFQQTMGVIFQGAATGAAFLRDALQPIGSALQTLAPLIASVLSNGGTMLAGMLKGISEALAQPAVSDGLSAALGALGAVANSIPWDILGQALGQVGQLVAQVAPLVITVLQAIAPLLPPLISMAGQLASAILPVIQQILPPVVAVIQSLVPVITALLPVLSVVAQFATGIFVPAFHGIALLIQTVVVPAVQFFADIFAKAVAVVHDLFAGDFSSAWQLAKDLVVNVAGKISELVSGLAGKIVQWLSTAGAGIVSTMKSAWDGAVSAVQSGISSAISWVAGLPGRVLSALGNMASTLYQSGAALLQGFLDGIKSKIASILSTVSGALSKVRNLFPFSPAKEGPFSGRGWVLYSGEATSQAYGEGIRRAASRAVAAAHDLMTDTASVFDNAGSLSATISPTLTAAVTAQSQAVTVTMPGADRTEALLSQLVAQGNAGGGISKIQLVNALSGLLTPSISSRQGLDMATTLAGGTIR